jgi:putative drug exporter of the RND superfamily
MAAQSPRGQQARGRLSSVAGSESRKMFDRLGRFVAKTWPLWLLVWGAAVVAIGFFAPSWDSVVDPRNSDFLPANSPSRLGTRVFDQAFPNDASASNVVLVVYRDQGQLSAADHEFVDAVLAPRLEALRLPASSDSAEASSAAKRRGPDENSDADADAESPITQVSTASSSGMSGILNSADGQATLLVADLRADFMSYQVVPLVAQFEKEVQTLEQNRQIPAGLKIAESGSAVVGRDIKLAERQSADQTGFWTVALVVILLLGIYRAPLLVLVPLVTLSVAFKVCLGTVALFAWWRGIKLFENLDVYSMVLAYGVGVDYALFLIARYREELESGSPRPQALATSIWRVGAAIAASAGTGIFGIAMMAFASFGKLSQAGLTISFGLFVMLCAALTLTPPLLMLGRRWVFWPEKLRPASVPDERPTLGMFDRFWHRVGDLVVGRPATVWLIGVAVLMPFAVGAVLQYDHLNYGLIDALPGAAPSVEGTNIVRAHFSPGETGPVTIVWQDPQIDFRDPESFDVVATLTQKLLDDKTELGIADIRSLSQPLGSESPAEQASQPAQSLFERTTTQAAVRRRAIHHYVGLGDEGSHVTQFDVVLAVNPFARESIPVLDRLQAAIHDDLAAANEKSAVYPIGTTASMRDLRTVAAHDRTLINVLVVVAVLVVLLLLGLQPGLAIYLVLTVIFSYLASLGVTFAVFRGVRGDNFEGLDWTVPLFLFTILVAVGIDYNILLVSRIHEEEHRHDPVRSIAEALGHTGMIISSCGIIMAGTFASLLLGGRLADMAELGFALPFGILLDTFFVRPLIVPSFLALAQSGRLGAVGRLIARPRRIRTVTEQPSPAAVGETRGAGSD